MKQVLFYATMAAALSVSSYASASTFALKVTNQTKSVVNAFYTSPVGTRSWEEDMFGDKALAPGQSITVRFSDDRNVCRYDMRFEFQGDALEPLEDTQNLCELGEYEITE